MSGFFVLGGSGLLWSVGESEIVPHGTMTVRELGKRCIVGDSEDEIAISRLGGILAMTRRWGKTK